MFEGKTYLLTWRTGQNSFDWRSGVSFCQSQGMRLVSLDTSQKMEHFLGLLKTDRAPYFWAGGQVTAQSLWVIAWLLLLWLQTCHHTSPVACPLPPGWCRQCHHMSPFPTCLVPFAAANVPTCD